MHHNTCFRRDMNASESVGLLSLRSIGDFIPQLAWHGHVGWLRWTKCACCSPERGMADCNMRRSDARTVFERCLSTHFRITGTDWRLPVVYDTCQMFRTGPVRSSHGQWYITKFQHLPWERDGALEIRCNAVEEGIPSATLNMGITCPEYCPQLSTIMLVGVDFKKHKNWTIHARAHFWV